MDDPWNPSHADIRQWAYSNEMIPEQDWELALIGKVADQQLCLTLAADRDCPNRTFFLGCLYVFTGDTIRGTIEHPIEELESLLDRCV